MILSICYIFLLFQLLTKVEMNSNSGYNIIPFEEIFRYEVGSRLFIYNVFGNIMAFVLFGLIISCYIKPKTVFPPFVISLLVSITVEFVQLNIGRSFDVDDVILNVVGGIIGFLLYIGFSAIRKHLPKVFQKDGIYKQNNIYSFDLRGLEFSKIMKLKQVLTGLENDYFKIIQINLQNHEQIKINKYHKIHMKKCI